MQTNEADFETHIDDIVKAIGDKLERSVIVTELKRYVEEYGIDLATAKESIVRKHYGNPSALQMGAEKLLAQVGPGENNVQFKAKILSVYRKEITTKEGAQKVLFEGELGDSTMRMRYSYWSEQCDFEGGDVVEVLNAYSKSWNDKITLNINEGSIKKITDKDLESLDLGVVKSKVTQPGQEFELVDLKPGMSMRTMKTDMSGSAIVLGVMKAVAHQKPKKNVMGILAVAENMPGGNAQRPGDVVKAMNGKTVEIGNTDAEGRLVLSDALSYAVNKGINKIIDIATLTGAISIALGNEYTGLFGNDQKFIDEFLNSAKNTGEKFWQLPVDDNYSKLYKNSIADIENIGGREAGSITGAMIIGEFAGKASWIHLDIASTITSPKNEGYNPKGPTGVSVRTILNLLKNS